jgi:hypothetical protein
MGIVALEVENTVAAWGRLLPTNRGVGLEISVNPGSESDTCAPSFAKGLSFEMTKCRCQNDVSRSTSNSTLHYKVNVFIVATHIGEVVCA